MLDALFARGVLVFTVPALLGSAVLFLKLGMMLLGGLGGDIDADADVDLDAGGMDADGDSTGAFTFVSIQSIAAFMMGFGWAGLIGAVTLGWEMPSSAALALAGGGSLLWLFAMVIKAVYDMQGSGHVRIARAIGIEGSVYLRIPASTEGRGRVRLVIDERERYYDASSAGPPIDTGTRIRVVRVNADNTVTVAPA